MKKSCITYHNKKIFKVVQHFTNKQHRLYIFIGPAKLNIQTILKKIEKDGFNKLNRDDENILVKQYGPNYRDLFGPVLPSSTYFCIVKVLPLTVTLSPAFLKIDATSSDVLSAI